MLVSTDCDKYVCRRAITSVVLHLRDPCPSLTQCTRYCARFYPQPLNLSDENAGILN
jgi:hypothetical protein